MVMLRLLKSTRIDPQHQYTSAVRRMPTTPRLNRSVICGIGAWRVCTDYVSDDARVEVAHLDRGASAEPLGIMDPNAGALFL